MMEAQRIAASLLVLGCLLLLAGCSGADARAQPSGTGKDMVARHGSFRQRVLLTGELEAERGEAMPVPRTNAFQLQVRWIAEDGALVKAGDRVVEFDNAQFASDLEEKRLRASDAGSELEKTRAETRTALAESQFQVEKAKSEMEKARIAAALPQDLLSLRDYQERQLALKRAQSALAKAEEDLAAQRATREKDVDVQRISMERSRREIQEAEEAIDALTLRAPRSGMALIAEHPWEGRKFQIGDTVWVGMDVASLPDLSSMIVRASLSDVDDGLVQPGMEVLCVLDAHPGKVYKGRVMEISPVARELNRSPLLRYFPVRIALERSDPERMRPGMSVRVEVMGQERRNVLLVPRESLDFSGAKPRVLLADGGAAEVRLGPCGALECVVESGLDEGARLRSKNGGAR